MKKNLKVRKIFTAVLVICGLVLIALYLLDKKPILNIAAPVIIYFTGVILMRIPCSSSDNNYSFSGYNNQVRYISPDSNSVIIARVIGYMLMGISFVIMFYQVVN